MAFPILLQKLFANLGAGPLLRSDILPPATTSTIGGVKIGRGVNVADDGTISVQKVDLSPYAERADVTTQINNKAAAYLPLAGGVMEGGAEAGINFNGHARLCQYTEGAISIRNLKNREVPKLYFDNRGIGGAYLEYHNPGYYFYFTAQCRAPSFRATSDKRLKDDIEPAAPKLDTVHCYSYTLKSDGKKHVGLIAQEVQKVMPAAVGKDEKGYLSLDYNAVVAALVEEVNALRAEVKALKEC